MKSLPHLPTWETLYSFIVSLYTKLDQAPLGKLCVWKALINHSLSTFVFLLPSPCLTIPDAGDLSHRCNPFVSFRPQFFIEELTFESNSG